MDAANLAQMDGIDAKISALERESILPANGNFFYTLFLPTVPAQDHNVRRFQ